MSRFSGPRSAPRITGKQAPRKERAVERTAPLALISYSLTVLWYVQYGQRTQGGHNLRRYAGDAAGRLVEGTTF